MSCFEIYYDGGAKKMRPINNFEEYAAIRNSTKNRRNTKLAREGNDEAKRKMVLRIFSWVCRKESGSNIPPVLGDGNIYGFPGCFLCSSTIRSTAC